MEVFELHFRQVGFTPHAVHDLHPAGTVLGQGPVLLHDNLFRVDVNLVTRDTIGKMFLVNRIDGPVVDCVIEIVGTGLSGERNGLADYSGRCRFRGKAGR